MEDRIITLDSERGKQLGFTSDLFDGYLWKKDGSIVLSFIISKKPNQGNLSRLIDKILAEGYDCHVPTPFARMESILRKKNFQQTFIFDEQVGCEVEVWIKKLCPPRSA